MKRIYRYFCIFALAVAALSSCVEKVERDPRQNQNQNQNQDPNQGQGQGQGQGQVSQKPSDEIRQADQFAIDMFSSYYLWSQEVKSSLSRLDPDTCMTPIPVVKEIRYHKSGKEVDHWTQLTNNLGQMTSSVQGLGLSYGYGLQGFWVDNTQSAIVLVVQYVNKGKPAEKAGLKRGDVIWTLGGQEITLDNYYDAFESESVVMGVGKDPSSLRSVSMKADKEWEDPVIVNKTFDINGKKVGYLFYSAFDLLSASTLPKVFRKFKEDGISELIIDLRYNGGGYVFTEVELASMIAPPANVAAGDIFQTEIYNAAVTEYYKANYKDYDFNTYFMTKFKTESGTTVIDEDVSDANPGVGKLYAIVTDASASASEGLLVGLGPYMDVVLVGERTYGKYCAGYMMSPENLYGTTSTTDYSKITKWGMYVMVSMFADKNGKNSAQPDGIPVNIKAEDNVLDGFDLGDENETMLKAALTAAGKTYTGTRSATVEVHMNPVPGRLVGPVKPKGFLIKSDLPAPLDLSNLR